MAVPAAAAAAATVGAEVVEKTGTTASNFFERSGIFKIISGAFDHFRSSSLSVHAAVKNESSLVLTDSSWYAHHGSHVDPVKKDVQPGETLEIDFKKARNSFFGLSGYFQFTYATGGGRHRRLIVTFSVPWRDKNPNKISLALLDESKLTRKEKISLSFGADMYSKLKEKNIQRKMAAYDTAVVKKACKNPSVRDNTIVVSCTMGGTCEMTLNVVIRNNRQ